MPQWIPRKVFHWESNGTGEYDLSEIERSQRGTEIILHLKAEEEELLSSWRLKSIVTKYSDHVSTSHRDAKGKRGRRTY